ncbi:MAG: PepSY domain-containing protein [Candidatus Nitronauta litoralis]|uniref:PepSY domain-containing protein n=1 Tax=Candidatus Nitronauta litoralis TaxID=2705533 RepID=A0A7T0G142_9BACT|nr:MAG: PepSY domain-containing protein [Candidatus Nitronauta litoralis]
MANPENVEPSRSTVTNRRTPLPSASNRAAGRPLAFLIHSLLGLKLSFLTLLVLGTGTLATVSHEIDWLRDPSIRASPGTHPVDLSMIWNTVQKQFPDSRLEYLELSPEEIAPWAGLGFAPRVTLYLPDGKRNTVFVNPDSGHIIGQRGHPDFPWYMRWLHLSLFFYPLGFFLVCLVSFLLLISTVTGLMIFKRFTSSFFKLPRRNKGLRTFLGDLHRLVSVWSLWFILLISLTGVWYLAEELLWRSGLPQFADNALRLTESDIDNLPTEVMGPLPFKTLLDRAQNLMPDLKIRSIYWGRPPLGAVQFSGQTGAWLTRDRASFVSLNPYTGAVLEKGRAEELNAFWRFSHMADPIHFGNFGGLPTKLIWFGFGTALCLLSVTGVWIFLKRTVRATQQFAPESDSPSSRLWWLGKWKWINIAVLVIPAAGFIISIQPEPIPQWVSLGKKSAGPYQAELKIQYPNTGSNPLKAKVELSPDSLRKIKTVYLKANLPNASPALLEGSPSLSPVVINLKTLSPDPPSFGLTIHEWKGATHRVAWP